MRSAALAIGSTLLALAATAATARGAEPVPPSTGAASGGTDAGEAGEAGETGEAADPVEDLRLPRERGVTLGAELGMQALPARAGPAAYAPGLAWAASARTELARWMGLRLLARHSSHAVELMALDVTAVAEGTPRSTAALEQRPLEAWLLAAQLEPTWHLTPRLRLWLGVGVGWLRVEAPAARGTLGGCRPVVVAGTEVPCEVAVSARTGLATELGATLGSAFELVPRWLELTLSTGLGAVVGQSGTLFGSRQVFAGGSMYVADGYPQFAGSASLLVGLGLRL